jgi:type IV pilus assembly protein PilB
VQQNVKKGMTFAAALRSFLRQDPDVIMVGEIRDLETAEIAVKAAQTGHWCCPPCTPTMRPRPFRA